MRKPSRFFLPLVFGVLIVVPGFAGHKVEVVPQGSKIYIAPMPGGLEGFIAAEVIKQKLPVRC